MGAVAAVRKARVGFVRNELLALDTPMGRCRPGPLVNAVIGPDALLLGLPALVQIAQRHPLSWTTVLVQAVVAGSAPAPTSPATTAGPGPERCELHSERAVRTGSARRGPCRAAAS